MGHKVNPIGFRLGYIKTWSSNWYADRKNYADLIFEDFKIRKYIKKEFLSANIASINIERQGTSKVRIIIHSARPGVIIGRRGADIDRLKEDLQKISSKEIIIDIKEVKNPSASAQLVAENVAFQLEKRIAHRRAMKRAIQQAMDSGALGIKVICSGRLGGAEMSRREVYKLGKLPLHTLRADIDYGFHEALTTYGLIGVKCWVYHGDVLDIKIKGEQKASQESTSKEKEKSEVA